MAKMKKINLKSKLTWKNILIVGLSVLLLIGAIFGISALFNESEKTTKTINPSFAIGGLTETGTYLETTESIYTKDSFECKGLNVKMAFDNNISYRIFFYDYNDNFVNATDKLTTNYSEDIDLFVKSARIVITPNEDSKISWYEKSGYAKQLTISVDKEQGGLPKKYNYDIANATRVDVFIASGTCNATSTAQSIIINVTGLKNYYKNVSFLKSDPQEMSFHFLTTLPKAGETVEYADGNYHKGTYELTFEIPSNCNYIVVPMSSSTTNLAPDAIIFFN